MMEKMTDGLKKVVLAGIGAMATTAEKSKDILDEMVKKGELTVEQGKILNQELKHNIKETIRERKTETDDLAILEEFRIRLQDMTPDQIEWIKALLQEMECGTGKEKEKTKLTNEDAAEQQGTGEE